MPIEAITSQAMPASLQRCPHCNAAPFEPFLRGMVTRTFWLPWTWKRRDIWAVICRGCKGIVGYEAIP
jgi:hypothetical protein